jgi:DNA-binding MarR family transcriptional regulator
MNVSADTTASGCPPIFGTSARTEIMAMLMQNGPMHVRAIGRARECDSAGTFRTVERLVKSGMCVKRDRPGGRKYVAVNRGHFAWYRLRVLLEALCATYRIPAFEQPTHRWYLPRERNEPHPEFDDLTTFGSYLRSSVLMLLAVAGEMDVTRLTDQSFSTSHTATWHVANALERDGLVTQRRFRGRRILSLDPRMSAAEELGALLRRMAQAKPTYRVKVIAAASARSIAGRP